MTQTKKRYLTLNRFSETILIMLAVVAPLFLAWLIPVILDLASPYEILELLPRLPSFSASVFASLANGEIMNGEWIPPGYLRPIEIILYNLLPLCILTIFNYSALQKLTNAHGIRVFWVSLSTSAITIELLGCAMFTLLLVALS